MEKNNKKVLSVTENQPKSSPQPPKGFSKPVCCLFQLINKSFANLNVAEVESFCGKHFL
jgi:hypothetical protein